MMTRLLALALVVFIVVVVTVFLVSWKAGPVCQPGPRPQGVNAQQWAKERVAICQ